MRRPKRNIFYKLLLFMEALTLRRNIREAIKQERHSVILDMLWEEYREKKEELKRII